jgi:hypothetical protein
MIQAASLWVHRILHKARSRASLILVFSFVLIASAQNSPSQLPRQSASDTFRQWRGPLRPSGQFQRAIPHGLPLPGKLRVVPRATTQGTTASAQSQLFLDTSAPQYPTGISPSSVAVGDFNGDGKADLAVANSYDVQYAGSVSILLGNGNGTVQTHVDYPVGNSAIRVAVGDFNGDGKADLAVTSYSSDLSGFVSILLGNGDGTFQTHVDYATGGAPVAVTIGDFNGDGKVDLAVPNWSYNSVVVLLGNGNGTFQTHVDYATGNGSFSVAEGDFNGDAKADLAVTNLFDNSISVLLGNGDGTFQTHVDYAAGNSPTSMVGGEFNGDAKADLAVTNGDNSVIVLLGNGDGTFQTHVDYATGNVPSSVAVGDFNGDGKADLAVTNVDNSVIVLLGNGDGTFQTHVDYATGNVPSSVAVGDFNGDGKADLAVTNEGDYSVSVLLGNGDGTFQTLPFYPTGRGPTSLAVGDFNGDGKPDLAIANSLDNSVSVLLGNGNGTFQTRVDYATGNDPNSVAVGDFNGDGKVDLAIANYWDSSVSVLLGNGNGTFQRRLDYATGAGAISVAVRDFNGDGKADLGVTNYPVPGYGGFVSILLGNGDGTFQTHVDYAVGNYPTSVAVSDFNGDGKPDLAVTNAVLDASADNSVVSVLLGNGDGTFQTHVDYETGVNPASVAVGDFNGDGKPDLAVANYFGYSVSVLLGHGDGTFQTRVDYAMGNAPGAVTVGDFNGDGKADLAVSAGPPEVSVLLGNGDGTFQTGMDYARGQGNSAVTVADFNSDGAFDLAFLAPGDDLGILLNLRGTVVEVQSSGSPSASGQSVTLTATVRASLSRDGVGIPSGLVTFLDGTQELGSETLSASGVASFSTATLNTGTHTLTVVYRGDDNFNPHSSAVLNQVVAKAQDFGMSATPGGGTVTAGTSGDFTVTAMAVNGFDGQVSLSCEVSPTPAFAPTCALSPTSITLAANGSATSKLTVTTTGSTASVRPVFHHGSSPLYALWPPILGLVVLGVGFGSDRSRKMKIPVGLLVGLLLVGLGLQTACGGGNSSYHNGFSGTPRGQYTITVNATSGSMAHTAAVTLTVQ